MWSNKYISIPFQDKGRSKNGADCWGLCRIIYKDEINIELPELVDYEDTNDKHSILKLIKENTSQSYWQRVEIKDLVAFDVLIYEMVGSMMHIGIVVQPGIMIHSQRGSGVTHSEYLKDKKVGKLVGAYRYAKYSDSAATV